MTMVRMAAGVGLLALLGVSACGDAPTTDDRGYTKAPLEDPGAFISPEEPTAMDALGDPDALGEGQREEEAVEGEDAAVES